MKNATKDIKKLVIDFVENEVIMEIWSGVWIDGVRFGENRNRRKLTKKERKERRKQRKMARRERRRLLRKQNRKNKKNKNRRQTRSLKQCRTKYIDSGDCPHCSSTCPPLKNLETGKLKNHSV